MVAIGAAFVIVGALLLPWFIGLDPPPMNPVALVQAILGSTGLESGFVEAPVRILLVVLGALMLLGLGGDTGSLSRKSAVLVVLLSAGYLVFLGITPGMFLSPLDIGLPAIWIGAALGYAGGLLIRMKD
jgi:hypothetical protein